MAKTVCRAKLLHEVKERGKESIEWRNNQREPQRYCYGYKDMGTEGLLETCRNCVDNVRFAQRDLEQYLKNNK